MTRRLAAATLFGVGLLILPGCAGPGPKRWGFAPEVQRVPLVPRDPRVLECASRSVAAALAGLPDSSWETYPQLRLPDQAPLQWFPRLTAPAFAGRTPACHDAWYVPVLFDESEETALEGTYCGARPHLALGFWLEPAKGGPRLEVRTDWLIPVRELGPSLDELLAEHEIRRRAQRDGVVLVVPSDALEPGYYWLRLVPRFADGAAELAKALPVERAVAAGDLQDVLDTVDGRVGDSAAELEGRDPVRLRAYFACQKPWYRFGLVRCPHPYKHFWPRMHQVGDALGPAGRPLDGERARRVADALQALYGEDRTPAGVYLDALGKDEALAPYSFAVAADLQDSRDTSAFRRFLRFVSLDDRYERAGAAQRALREELHRLETDEILFVLFDGDLADAQASSDLFKMGMNVLGLWPPSSPYGSENRALAGELRRFRKPFVAVPGNHDGYVGYPGILNRIFTGFGFNLRTLDRLFNDWIPVLLKPPVPPQLRGRPRYDGLGEWQYAFGPTSYVFRFRGSTLAGLNSYHLDPRERAGVGSVVINWGGGLPLEDTRWLDAALERLPLVWPDPLGRRRGSQFLYLHHDPRAATPSKSTLTIDEYGIYDEIDNWFSYLTIGHFGLGHSPRWDMYLPVLTPLAHHGSRLLDELFGGRFRLQEKWMRLSLKVPWDRDRWRANTYHSRDLIESINRRLVTEPVLPDDSYLFFGHNDVPLGPGAWVHEGDVVFPEIKAGRWNEGREYHRWFRRPHLPLKWPFRYLGKLRNDEPPDWAKRMRAAGPGTAKVIRLDDVSSSGPYGFHLITVDPRSGEVVSRWFDFPQGPAP